MAMGKRKPMQETLFVSPNDPESRITQMKDGRTHLAYKAEHVAGTLELCAALAKRYVIAAAAHNLGRLLRKLFGMGKPKALQAAGAFAALAYFVSVRLVVRWWRLTLLCHSGDPARAVFGAAA